MRYSIRRAVLGSVSEVQISAEQYSLLKKARNVLSSALGIEEKYEILIANFLELEKQLLAVAATNAVRNTTTYSEFFDIRSTLNICLVNLLTAARLYLDQLPQDVADCVPDKGDAVILVRTRCSKEYDDHFEYRFIEALRNHVQHRGVPIHFTKQGSHWTSLEGHGLMEFTVDIFAQRQYLEEDGKFKKAILAELTEDVDLKAACRSYVESLSEINEYARQLTSETVQAARVAIEAAHKQYAEIDQESPFGLTAFAHDEGRPVSSVPLVLDWDDVRIELQKRNRRLVNLRRRYVSGKVTTGKK